MLYQSFDQKSYRIHTIKTDRFKLSKIEVFFRMKINKETLAIQSFLAGMLNESSKKYPTRKCLAIKCEDLYKTFYYCITHKVGDTLNTIFEIDLINPKYIDEPEYLEDAISFLFDMILHPNVKNNEFDLATFNIVKNNILLDIESIEEDANRKAINNALNFLDKDSMSSFSLLGTKEEVEKITPEKLYQTYLDLMQNAVVDIFIIGDLKIPKVVEYIKKYYKKNRIINNDFKYYIDNKVIKKAKYMEDKSSFAQTQVVSLYNTIDLTKLEKEVTFHLMNYILGSGGLNSKLYKYIRENNSYCYRIASMYFKYDNLLCISTSLAKENINDALKLIKKSIIEMKKGMFTEEDLVDAKNNMILSLKLNKNNPAYLLAVYEFQKFVGVLDIDEKIEAIDKITKEDIINVSMKIKENCVYVLSEDKK